MGALINESAAAWLSAFVNTMTSDREDGGLTFADHLVHRAIVGNQDTRLVHCQPDTSDRSHWSTALVGLVHQKERTRSEEDVDEHQEGK